MVLKAEITRQRFLAKLRDGGLVEIDDQLAVESDLDPRPGALDVDAVPLSRGRIAFFRGATYRYNDPLECTVGGLPASSNNWIS